AAGPVIRPPSPNWLSIASPIYDQNRIARPISARGATMVNQTVLTDALERELVARQADRISQPIDLRRLARTWGRARRAARRSLPHDKPAARLVQLTLGLLVYGISEALMLAPSVGVDPWDVFHTGLSRITGIPVGTVLILIGGVVLLLWIPLRQVPGVGTVANIFVIGVVIDVLLGVMPV